MSLYSLEIEKHFLSGLINSPNIYFDLDGLVDEKDFSNKTHEIIFSTLRDLIISGEKFDKIILAQKIKNLGIKLQDNINIFDYVDALCFLKVQSQITFESAKELVKLRIKRQIVEAVENVREFIAKEQNKSVTEIVTEAESILSKGISVENFDEEAENLFDDLEELIEERGNNPIQESGLLTPYSEYNRFYGGLRKGSLFAIASRPKHGKSTFLAHLTFTASKLSNFKIPALFLDTEMFTVDMRFRFVSMLSGVPVWYLETGNWRKNPEMYDKVRKIWKEIKNFQFYHYRVGKKNINQVSSIIRRWILSKVKGKINTNGEAVVCYDYFKLTGEKVGENWAEHQILGDKIDNFINLSAKYQFYPLSAIQLNRTGESFNRKKGQFVDDASAISGTDKLQWFGSSVGIFRRKTFDEIALDGPQFGTHLYLNTASRFGGKDSQGHSDYLKRTFPDGEERYMPNYINFNINNFNVEERGSLVHVIDAFKEQVNLTENKNSKEGELI